MRCRTGTICLLACCLGLLSCADRKLSSSVISIPKHFDWQGHRGCRGLMPENTVAAFLEALKYPVTTLELDVVLSGDGQVVVSHEPWMNPEICTGQGDGPVIPEAEPPNLYTMTLDEIRRYDCGSKGNPKFHRQRAIETHKPTLAEVVFAVKASCAESHRIMPAFNIEIKSKKSWYDVYVPQPDVFVDRVLQEIEALHIDDNTILQSFDLNVLRALHQRSIASIRISYLVDKTLSMRQAIKRLGFYPEIYSPHYGLVGKGTIAYARKHGIKVIPWTVNTTDQFHKLISLGVDGLITDYPDLIDRVYQK